MKMTYDYKKLSIEDIIEYCQKNNQVEWLKAKVQERTIQKRHTGKIEKTKENGKKVLVADKKSPVVEVEADITFIEIKKAFAEKFMPEILPEAKPKKKTMKELILEL